jgi:hypothetical protein
MPTNERKRESLMEEATAYSRRILLSFKELSFRGKVAFELFAGQRSDGRWSLYFDETPVIQFDRQGGLRRVYIDGMKLVASESRWVELVRQRRGGKVEHVRQPWSALAQSQLVEDLRQLLGRTCQQLEHSDLTMANFKIEAVVPSNDSQMFPDLIHFLKCHSQELQIANEL